DKQLDFEVEMIEGTPATMATDVKRLQQVLKNLLSNAFKFTEEGSVTLTVSPADENIEFRNEVLKRADHVVAFSAAGTFSGITAARDSVCQSVGRSPDCSAARFISRARAGRVASSPCTCRPTTSRPRSALPKARSRHPNMRGTRSCGRVRMRPSSPPREAACRRGMAAHSLNLRCAIRRLSGARRDVPNPVMAQILSAT